MYHSSKPRGAWCASALAMGKAKAKAADVAFDPKIDVAPELGQPRPKWMHRCQGHQGDSLETDDGERGEALFSPDNIDREIPGHQENEEDFLDRAQQKSQMDMLMMYGPGWYRDD